MMTTLSDIELLKLNKKGFIPGPEEEEAHFLKRVEQCLHFATHPEGLKPFTPQERMSEIEQQKALDLTETLFDVRPNWVPIYYSSHRLAFWQGAATWLIESKEGLKVAAIQLQKRFQAKPKMWGIYHRDELVAHELVHTGRLAFNEPKFEEVLAYRTAPRSLRRWLGALIESPKEGWVFLASIFLFVGVDWLLLLTGYEKWLLVAGWLKLIPCLLLLFFTLRGACRLRQLQRCRNKIGKLAPQHVLPIIYRLTDQEIMRFGKLSTAEILTYIREQSSHSLRWRLIQRAYFS